MKISIIVPVYNKEEYLPECLDSLINQTYEDIEIILVDDESKDRSGLICDEYAARDSRIIVIHQKNTGAAGAWRAGFAKSSGEYICFVDSDDWIDLDMLEKLAAHTSDVSPEVIISDYVIERVAGLQASSGVQALSNTQKSRATQTYVYGTAKPGEYNREQIVSEIIPSLWGYENRRIHMSRCMKLFSRELITNNEKYCREGLRFGEDNALTLPCLLDAHRMYILDKQAMYHYRFVESSVVHSYDKTLMSSIERLQCITEEAIADKFPEQKDKLVALSQKEFVFLLMYAIKNEVRGNTDSYIKNIRNIVQDKYSILIANNPVEMSSLANRMIYRVMRKPSTINCKILRFAMNMWSKR